MRQTLKLTFIILALCLSFCFRKPEIHTVLPTCSLPVPDNTDLANFVTNLNTNTKMPCAESRIGTYVYLELQGDNISPLSKENSIIYADQTILNPNGRIWGSRPNSGWRISIPAGSTITTFMHHYRYDDGTNNAWINNTDMLRAYFDENGKQLVGPSAPAYNNVDSGTEIKDLNFSQINKIFEVITYTLDGTKTYTIAPPIYITHK